MVCWAIVVYTMPPSSRGDSVGISVQSRCYLLPIFKEAFVKSSDQHFEYLKAHKLSTNGVERLFTAPSEELQSYVFINDQDYVLELKLLRLECAMYEVYCNEAIPYMLIWDESNYCNFAHTPEPHPMPADFTPHLDILTMIRMKYASSLHILMSKFSGNRNMFISEKSTYCYRGPAKFKTIHHLLSEY